MKILIAEDTEDSRIILERVLSKQGYEVISSSNGMEALKLARANPPDLIISDIMMPEMDGFELCRKVSAEPKLKNIPFIFYTAVYTEHHDEELAMALGAIRFVIKPQEPQALIAIVQEVLEASQAEVLVVAEPQKADSEIMKMHLHSVGRKLDQKVAELEQERDALKKSKEKYRQLVESVQSHYFFYSHDTKGVFTYLSPSVETVLGYTPKEFLIHYTEYLTDNPINKEVEQYTELALKGKEQPPYEIEIYHKDGSKYWIEVKERPVLDGSGQVIEVNGIAHNITQRKLMEFSLEYSNRVLLTHSSINQTLIHSTNEQQLLNDICNIIVKVGNYPMVWVGYVNTDKTPCIETVATAGDVEGYLEATSDACFTPTKRDRACCPSELIINTEKTTVANDIQGNSQYADWFKLSKQFGIQSTIALPLRFGESGRGVLNIYAAEVSAFHEEEVKLLTELSDDLAFGIQTIRQRKEHQQNIEKLQCAMEQTIQAIANTVERRDPYTAGHQRRVAKLSVAIAAEMGLDDERIKGIRMGAMIHDIGKIYIPAEILNRPGKLSENEFNIIKTHSDVGYDIIKGVDFPWPVAQMIRQHHERLDGSGYPDGLKGDVILLEARILAVADVIEAMVSHRPYRAGLGTELAMEEIRKNSGCLYDTSAVNACLKLFENKNYSFQQGVDE